MPYHLGVDLGTTCVAAAVARASRVEMVTLGSRGVLIPAVVSPGDRGGLVSGETAQRRAAGRPDLLGRELKRRLGDPTAVVLGGVPFAASTLLAALLRDVIDRVADVEGAKPDTVVMTHPAGWGPFRRELFEEVPRIAGLSMAQTAIEAEAAVAYYAALRPQADGEIIAVYDLGGGTFDAAALRKRPDGVEVLGAPSSVENLGGLDFDEAILNYVNDRSDGALSDMDLDDPRTTIALTRLRWNCALAKESLSVDPETVIPVLLPNGQFDVTLTRQDFESIIRAPIQSTIDTLVGTLRSGDVAVDQLSAVLLVGGSSRIPLVSQMITEELGRPVLIDAHPEYTVAMGAAILARASGDTRVGVPTGGGSHRQRSAVASALPVTGVALPAAAPDRMHASAPQLTALPPTVASADSVPAPSRRKAWLGAAAVVLVLVLLGVLWWTFPGFTQAVPGTPVKAPSTTTSGAVGNVGAPLSPPLAGPIRPPW